LKRVFLGNTFTMGKLFIMKEEVPEFFCDTLEPHRRDLRNGEAKIMGETAIPEGRYKVCLDKSPKFKRMMPYVLSIPNFSGVMIHPGNDVDDTKGCILVGQELNVGYLMNSLKTFEKLFAMLEK